MHTIAEGDPAATLPSLIDDLARLREPITILRNGHGAAVLLSAKEYASIRKRFICFPLPPTANGFGRRSLITRTTKRIPANYAIDVAAWRVGRLPVLAANGSQDVAESMN